MLTGGVGLGCRRRRSRTTRRTATWVDGCPRRTAAATTARGSLATPPRRAGVCAAVSRTAAPRRSRSAWPSTDAFGTRGPSGSSRRACVTSSRRCRSTAPPLLLLRICSAVRIPPCALARLCPTGIINAHTSESLSVDPYKATLQACISESARPRRLRCSRRTRAARTAR